MKYKGKKSPDQHLDLSEVMQIFGFCSYTVLLITPEEALQVRLAFIKKCNESDEMVLQGVNRSDKCAPYPSNYFGCYKEQKRNTTLYVKCSYWFFYATDEHPITCQSDGTWEKAQERNYCRILPDAILSARREELFLYEFRLTNNATKREFERQRWQNYHKIKVDKLYKHIRHFDVVVCAIGLIILFLVVPLQNERIMLHRNLVIAFALQDILLICHFERLLSSEHALQCKINSLFIEYFFLCQICWMFNEGFYHVRQFFVVFIRRSYLWAYFLFGWGFPLVIVFGIYLPIRWVDPQYNYDSCWFRYEHIEGSISYIIYGPAFFILALNMLMVIYMMWVIWSKLRTEENSDLYKARKAIRGFLILMFLLGGGYLLTIVGPDDCIQFKYLRAIVFSTQGTVLCIANVFLSKDVWDSIQKKYTSFVNKSISFNRSSRPSLKTESLERKGSTTNQKQPHLSVKPNASKRSSLNLENIQGNRKSSCKIDACQKPCEDDNDVVEYIEHINAEMQKRLQAAQKVQNNIESLEIKSIKNQLNNINVYSLNVAHKESAFYIEQTLNQQVRSVDDYENHNAYTNPYFYEYEQPQTVHDVDAKLDVEGKLEYCSTNSAQVKNA